MDTAASRILEYVKTLADKAHGKQVRKYSGERYIVHPVRVMHIVAEYNNDLSVLSAALLHDVLEDTPVTAGEIRDALLRVMDSSQTEKTLRHVVELTDVFIKANYPGLNRRTRKEKEAQRLAAVSAEAQTIKYADLMDNVTDIVQHDADFARVFVYEAKRMLSAMQGGDPVLRERVVALVEGCLEEMNT